MFRAVAPSAFLLPLLLCSGPSWGAETGAQSAEQTQLESQIEATTEALNSLDSWLSEAEMRRVQLLREVRARDQAVSQSQAEVAASDEALNKLRSELAELAAQGEALAAKQETDAQRMAKHIAAAYRLSGQDFLRMLLDQESAQTAERMMIYHRYLIDARRQALESYRRLSAEIAQNARDLQRRQAAQSEERQRLATRRGQLESKRQERWALIEKLDAEVEGKQSERERLTRDRERLQALFTKLNQQQEQERGEEMTILDGAGFAALKGTLPWPLQGPLVSRFGQPRAGGRLRWHGLLVRADPGSPVRAVFGGRVVFADWLRGFGHLAIIDHGDGYMTLYGHADRLTKSAGGAVEAGEVIAQAGRSGGVQTSGLYFEIRQAGDAVDPLGWLAKRG